MNQVIQTYPGITTTGIAADSRGRTSVPLPSLFRSFAVEVAIPSGSITSWTVTLEGSLDGANWTVLATHNATIGSTVWAVDKPVIFMRANVSALTLNTAPSITVIIAACP